MTVRLAISASGDAVDCALEYDHRILTTRGEPRRDDLLPQIASLFTRAAIPKQHLTHLLLDVGPGSYTGLRCAAAFARTLAREHPSLQLLTTSSLAMLAHAAQETLPPHRSSLHVLLDARRGRWHHAAFEPATLRTIQPPHAAEPSAILRQLQPGAHVLAPLPLHEHLAGLTTRDVTLAAPRPFTASDLLSPTAPLQPAEPSTIEPLYLMSSYAEEP